MQYEIISEQQVTITTAQNVVSLENKTNIQLHQIPKKFHLSVRQKIVSHY